MPSFFVFSLRLSVLRACGRTLILVSNFLQMPFERLYRRIFEFSRSLFFCHAPSLSSCCIPLQRQFIKPEIALPDSFQFPFAVRFPVVMFYTCVGQNIKFSILMLPLTQPYYMPSPLQLHARRSPDHPIFRMYPYASSMCWDHPTSHRARCSMPYRC